MSYFKKSSSGHLLKSVGGHLVNDCTGSEDYWYRLTQCDVDCANADCNGSAWSILTDTNLGGFFGRVIRYEDKCWYVDREAPSSGAVSIDIGLITGSYADCEACCDGCYDCADCSFPIYGSNMSVTFVENTYTCYYSNDDWTNFYAIEAAYRSGTWNWSELSDNPVYPCSPVFTGTGSFVYDEGYASNGCGCHIYPLENPTCSSSQSDTDQIKYICSNGNWSKGPSGGGVTDGTYPNQVTLYLSDCEGGTITGNYYRSYPSGSTTNICGVYKPFKSLHQYSQKTFTLSGNDCEPGP